MRERWNRIYGKTLTKKICEKMREGKKADEIYSELVLEAFQKGVVNPNDIARKIAISVKSRMSEIRTETRELGLRLKV